ncbi:hypothetical protein [Nocardia stercoris]|uniref:Uncharacterized protein n=1 Tax=Nocardia stercoris TaxID=2483361 RepID=A0A3M2LBF7_9NOCA|nr:hypothetical protein [Nocardia stercoris]RMI34869.1 hypothetical protein EBN03_00365 [Nocardia stercoris]
MAERYDEADPAPGGILPDGQEQLIDEVFDLDDVDADLDLDLGDDEQADEVRAYERYILDPPADLVIRDYESEDNGPLMIDRELDQEWTRRRGRTELAHEDDRPAEVAAMEITEGPGD